MNFTDDEIKNCSATKGDLLVCEGGAGYGRSAIWPYDYDICLQNHVHRLRPYVQGICEYVYYLIYFLKETNALASVGTAMPGLSANRVKNLLIPFPPLGEQQRIVQRLQEIEPLLDKYSTEQMALESLNTNVNGTLKKSILQEAIQGKLVEQRPDDESASVLLHRIKAEKERLIKEKKIKCDKQESVIFRGDDNCYYEHVNGKVIPLDADFPASWGVVRLGSICQLLDGEKRNGKGICMDAKFLRGKSEGIVLDKGRLVAKGENIILVDGENSGEVFSVPQDGYMGSTFKQLWVSNEMHLPYVLYFLLFHKAKLRNSKKGAAIPHLNRELFNKLVIGIPPIEEQRRITQRVSNLFEHLK